MLAVAALPLRHRVLETAALLGASVISAKPLASSTPQA
jgi:hypothetical protein